LKLKRPILKHLLGSYKIKPHTSSLSSSFEFDPRVRFHLKKEKKIHLEATRYGEREKMRKKTIIHNGQAGVIIKATPAEFASSQFKSRDRVTRIASGLDIELFIRRKCLDAGTRFYS